VGQYVGRSRQEETLASPVEAQDLSLRDTGAGSRLARFVFIAVILGWISFLTLAGVSDRTGLARDFPTLLVWTIAVAGVNLLPLKGWQSAPFAPDDPIALAAALVFSPVYTALILFLGAVDPRELRHGTSLTKALVNRSHVSLGWFLGSAVAHAAVQDPRSSDLIIPLAFLPLAVTTALNYVFVGTSIALERGYPFREVVRRLRLGTVSDFALAFVAWGALAAMLAALYERTGTWALLAFMGPTLLGRQVLERSQMFIDTRRAYMSTETAFRQLSRQIDQERNDERRMIAADLHDEVIPPLFQVSLMAEVVKRDLAGGLLLDLERDLPDVVIAANSASEQLRALIGDLRSSGLGRGGIGAALSRLTEVLSTEGGAQIHTSIQDVEADSMTQLTLYQIAKEALSNALQHSGASNIWVELASDEDMLRLIVKDDGKGFDPYVQKADHYGLHVMRERAQSVAGSLYVDSAPRAGCSVTGLIPRAHER